MYRVMVYWPREGAYGGGDDCQTKAEARAKAEKLLRLGYGKRDCPIHIIQYYKPRLVEEIYARGREP